MGTFGAGAWAGAALWNPAAVREKRVGGRGEEINPMREQSSSGSAAELKAQPHFIPRVPAVRCPAGSGYQLRFGHLGIGNCELRSEFGRIWPGKLLRRRTVPCAISRLLRIVLERCRGCSSSDGPDADMTRLAFWVR